MDIDQCNGTETNKTISKENSDTTLNLIPLLQNNHDIKHTKDTIKNPSSSATTDTTVKLTDESNDNCYLDHIIKTSDHPSSARDWNESEDINKSKR